MKKFVTIMAIETRVRRALAKEGKQLKKFAPKWHSTYGEYGIVNTSNNLIDDYGYTLEIVANKLGVLAKHEEIEI